MASETRQINDSFHSNMETDSGPGKRKCIIASLICSFIVAVSFASFILIDFTTEVTSDFHHHKYQQGVNPMVQVFNTMPNFTKYLRDENSFEDHFWNEPIFGGSILDPITFEDRSIPNNMENDLQEMWFSRGNYSGYFEFRNLKTGKNLYQDTDIFINDLSKEDYDFLKTFNNTETYPDNKYPNVLDLYPYMTGHVRNIYFQATDISYNPLLLETNAIVYIYEGYYKNGAIDYSPTYGRWFKRDLRCYVGFFAIDSDQYAFEFEGKGLVLQHDQILNQGIFDNSIDIVISEQQIDDFTINLTPI